MIVALIQVCQVLRLSVQTGEPVAANRSEAMEEKMSLIRWDPMREMDEVLGHYNRAIGVPNIMDMEFLPKGDWTPRVDIAESGKSFIIKMDVPEVDKKDVKISVKNGVLSIKGERLLEKDESGMKFHRVERYHGTFCRSFTLPENVDIGNVDATFKNGLLTVEVPKLEKTESPQVEVKIH
jgi:HSP20 family protein